MCLNVGLINVIAYAESAPYDTLLMYRYKLCIGYYLDKYLAWELYAVSTYNRPNEDIMYLLGISYFWTVFDSANLAFCVFAMQNVLNDYPYLRPVPRS